MTRRAAWLVAAALALAATLSPPLSAKGPSRAGIVVRDAEGDVREMCVLFDEDEITGAELLERSDLDVTVESGAMGTAVCNIEGTGCGRGDCFCEYPTFWGYWTRAGDAEWRFADVGAAQRTVRNGALDGWSYGKDGEPEPADLTFDDVCAAAPAVSATDARAERGQQEQTANPLTFAAFAGLLAAVAGLAFVLRRRRS